MERHLIDSARIVVTASGKVQIDTPKRFGIVEFERGPGVSVTIRCSPSDIEPLELTNWQVSWLSHWLGHA